MWKAADHQASPVESADITKSEWEIQGCNPVPVIDKSDPAPPEIIHVIRCQCRQSKKCITEACGSHKKYLSCTSFCNCSYGEDKAACCNPYTSRKDDQTTHEKDAELDDAIDQEDVEADGEEVFVECDSLEGERLGMEDCLLVPNYDWENINI